MSALIKERNSVAKKSECPCWTEARLMEELGHHNSAKYYYDMIADCCCDACKAIDLELAKSKAESLKP